MGQAPTVVSLRLHALDHQLQEFRPLSSLFQGAPAKIDDKAMGLLGRRRIARPSVHKWRQSRRIPGVPPDEIAAFLRIQEKSSARQNSSLKTKTGVYG